MLFYFYNFLLNNLNYAINKWRGLRRVSAPESDHKNGVVFFLVFLEKQMFRLKKILSKKKGLASKGLLCWHLV